MSANIPPVPPPAAPASGAPPKPAGARALTCPSCGASITLRALGQSVMLACPSCQSLLDVTRPEIRIIQKYQQEARRLLLPLGTRGTLRGQLFEVIGALGRCADGYSWVEYLLFNPYLGFRWLVYDQGHWNFGKAVKDVRSLSAHTGPFYEGRSFRWYQGGRAQVEWVIGEFYWRVHVGDVADTTDYVAVPFMLSREDAAEEVTWTFLTYLDSAEVDAAFHITTPPASDTAVNQPNPYSRRLSGLRRIVQGALAGALAIQLATCMVDRSATLPVGTYSFDRQSAGEEQVFGPLALRSNRSLNALSARADLNNSWVELEGSLVNDTTGQVYGFRDGFEYYNGVDSDGAWTEGGRSSQALIANVPAGSYHLVVAGTGAGPNGFPPAPGVELSLRHDIAPWRNFWISVVLILLYPFALFLRAMSFEQQRWSDEGDNPALALMRRVKSLGGQGGGS